MFARVVHQSGCLQGLSRLLLREFLRGEFAEFVVHQRQELVRNAGVARFDLLRDLRDVGHDADYTAP